MHNLAIKNKIIISTAILLVAAVFVLTPNVKQVKAIGIVFGGKVLAFIPFTPPIVIPTVPPITIPPCPPHVLIRNLAGQPLIGVTVFGKQFEAFTFEVPGVNTVGQRLPTPIFCSSIGYLVYPLYQEGSSALPGF